jgi:hypothetical protein
MIITRSFSGDFHIPERRIGSMLLRFPRMYVRGRRVMDQQVP